VEQKTIFNVLEIAMNLRYRTAALFVLVGVCLSAFVAPAAAAGPPNTYLFAPGEPYGLPKFGFSSSTIYGYGERIVHVRYGSRAASLGLEPGDVILSLNGYKLTYPGSWNDALSNALYNNNYIRLRIRDVRTGNIFVRETFVNYGGNGPVEHFYKTNNHVGPFGPKPHFDVHPVGPNLKTIKDIKKLLD
jgi:membrane-associated protease RseP (regulator of RpoE activity)